MQQLHYAISKYAHKTIKQIQDGIRYQELAITNLERSKRDAGENKAIAYDLTIQKHRGILEALRQVLHIKTGTPKGATLQATMQQLA